MYNKIKRMAVRHTIFNAVQSSCVCGYTAIIVKKEDLAICLQKEPIVLHVIYHQIGIKLPLQYSLVLLKNLALA